MAMNKERGNRDGTSRSTGMETFKVLLWANMDSEKAFYRENCDISTRISTFSTRQQALWCPPRSLLLRAQSSLPTAQSRLLPQPLPPLIGPPGRIARHNARSRAAKKLP